MLAPRNIYEVVLAPRSKKKSIPLRQYILATRDTSQKELPLEVLFAKWWRWRESNPRPYGSIKKSTYIVAFNVRLQKRHPPQSLERNKERTMDRMKKCLAESVHHHFGNNV